MAGWYQLRSFHFEPNVEQMVKCVDERKQSRGRGGDTSTISLLLKQGLVSLFPYLSPALSSPAFRCRSYLLSSCRGQQMRTKVWSLLLPTEPTLKPVVGFTVMLVLVLYSTRGYYRKLLSWLCLNLTIMQTCFMAFYCSSQTDPKVVFSSSDDNT